MDDTKLILNAMKGALQGDNNRMSIGKIASAGTSEKGRVELLHHNQYGQKVGSKIYSSGAQAQKAFERVHVPQGHTITPRRLD